MSDKGPWPKWTPERKTRWIAARMSGCSVSQLLARSDLSWADRLSRVLPRLCPPVCFWVLREILAVPVEISQRAADKNRAKSLAAYHDRGFKRHWRERLESAMRRVVREELALPEERIRRLGDLVAAGEAVVARHKRRSGNRVRAKLVKILRRRLEASTLALKRGQSKSKTARELVGCDLDELRTHLESQFHPGMTWGNHGYEGWHVDHIRPLAAFDLSDPEQQKQAFHFSNLQPLWKKDNLDKGTKSSFVGRPVLAQ